MPNLERFLNGIMMSGDKPEMVTKVYEDLKGVVNKNSEREIRFIEDGSYTLEQRFEKIMHIQRKCKEQLNFLDMTMLLWKGDNPDVSGDQKKIAKVYEEKIARVYEELKAIVNSNCDSETYRIEAGSIQDQSFENIQMKHNSQIAFLDMAMLLLDSYNPETIEEKREVAMAS